MKSRHIFFYLFLICANPHAYTQDLLKKYIHLPPQELTVEQYLYHIEEMTGYHLGYSSAIIDNKRIALYPDSIQLKELLDTLFASYSLQYVVKDNLLILSPQTDALVKSNLVKITGVITQEKSEKPVPFAAEGLSY